jgi:hypothetical protein
MLSAFQNWTTPIKKLETLLTRHSETLSITSSASHTSQQTSVQRTILMLHRAFSHLKHAKYHKVLVNVELLTAAVSWFTQGHLRFPQSAAHLGELLVM